MLYQFVNLKFLEVQKIVPRVVEVQQRYNHLKFISKSIGIKSN